MNEKTWISSHCLSKGYNLLRILKLIPISYDLDKTLLVSMRLLSSVVKVSLQFTDVIDPLSCFPLFFFKLSF